MVMSVVSSSPPLRSSGRRRLSSSTTREDQDELSARFYIAASLISGVGLFSSVPLPRGAWIGDYIGNLLTREEASRVPDDQSHFHMENQVLDMIIDGDILANEMRWINHSNRPNSFVWNTSDGRLRVHTKRSVDANEELTINYGSSHWTEEEKKSGHVKEGFTPKKTKKPRGVTLITKPPSFS